MRNEKATIEEELAERMLGSKNNFTSTMVSHMKKSDSFDVINENGTTFLLDGGKRYQIASGEGDMAEVRQGVADGNIGLIFFSTKSATLYKYEADELLVDKSHNKINTHGVKLFTKKAKLSTENISMNSLGFDKDKYADAVKAKALKIIENIGKRK